ncbi:RNA polymerase beta subunit [Methanococcus vannielii SB]|jgi:DNA-directed RNA polymerase subunit B"|uniref:DNA-directed RNA polymerase subunit Rpo2N n=1 Tax=Methanococcus vannielii (strain ATCC 35089 / DSM 1224 / JCM 13029 / OCM 148 / SB) TaxID=406327 RepID=RPO2N_METVS|nr:DNA-directed RNA polymerase subunit B'' [Methanococcus vannielii]P41558.1 RecName: Full=DNA-directed RNA polymerase subunit Rpo2N; AltName: Full=DNA-directed RNA polymerase subunit B'' [Methanococcus vannielii SB]ABR54577.1 RNA polymerase beta subunit [Methanococcus vannielii SB]CAA51726.1 DNA-directed RNA polymerase [Methanococcus vannielii]
MESRVIVDAFFRENSLVKHHIDSYDDFVENKIQGIIDEVTGVETEIKGGYKVSFGKVRVTKPINKEADGSVKEITPMEARIRNLAYSAPLYLEMIPLIGEGDEEKTLSPIEVYIGELPVMLGAKICHLSGKSEEDMINYGEDPKDPLGYFIVNGSEKAVVAQEDLIPNRILCEKVEKNNKIVDIAKVFSTRHGFRALCTVERSPDGLLNVSFPGMPSTIPLVILMRALGAESDREIMELISDEPTVVMQLVANLQEAREEHGINTTEDALEHIGKRVAPGQPKEYKLKRAETILCNYLLPHMGIESEKLGAKCKYLGRMAKNSIELYLGSRVEDDKDHYANKRLKLAGDLMEDLFRHSFNQLIKDIKYQLERQAIRNKEPSIQAAVRSDVLTERMRHAMATGNWVGGRTGVSQLLDRTSYLATVSQLRRVVSPLSRSQPHFEARDLHATQWGKICPSETPEGPNCGLVKNLAVMCKVTTDEEDEGIIQLIKEIGLSKDI